MSIILLSACATLPPTNMDNACSILREKQDWFKPVQNASEQWGVSKGVILATIHQESRFVHDARPPRGKILGFIPGLRPSNSYGYTQALKNTWAVYQRDTGEYAADRDDFADAADFVGWYHHQSFKRSGIRKNDPYHLYLAYHEGHGGFNKRTFKNKQWLKRVAKKVSARARRYDKQLTVCQKELESLGGWFFGLF
jgi:hypothetical protein